MPLIEVEQGTKEWLTMRAGMVTASRVADVVAKRKKQPKNGEPLEPLACRTNYLWEVVVSRLTGLNPETFVSDAMLWGTANEPLARAEYEMATGNDVEPGGFAIHDNLEFFGASCDGLIGTDGILECKCPTSAVHLQYVINQVVPAEYIPQMMAEMACAGRKWGDFVSYDPRMPAHLRLFVQRLKRDDSRIKEMEYEVAVFLEEVDVLMDKIKSFSGDRPE